jgi:subtilisin family serine protease
LHQWVKGKKDNPLRPFSHERVSIELTSPQAGYEVVLVDANTQQPIGRSRAQVSDGCASAIVRFEPKANQRYLVRVRWTTENSKPVGRFHLTVLGGRLQYTTAQGSVPFPGDGAEVVAVGAVDGRGRRLNYSSCGPCASSPKPDLVATVPFPSVWRPEQAFSGTSAAAPQAAALAALVWSRNPTWSANQVRETLGKAAYKVKAGHCPETGYGVVRLPK